MEKVKVVDGRRVILRDPELSAYVAVACLGMIDGSPVFHTSGMSVAPRSGAVGRALVLEALEESLQLYGEGKVTILEDNEAILRQKEREVRIKVKNGNFYANATNLEAR